MNIIIQGRQGSGKTLKADIIATAYPFAAVMRVSGLDIPSLRAVEIHATKCFTSGDTPLFIFDDLSRDQLVKSLSVMKALKSKTPDNQIDCIYITNDLINLS